jgi:tetratricopeptide (TPR) repeat protein
LLALDPDDLDSAHDALRAAESKTATELIRKYAELAWDIAVRVAQKPKPADADEAESWAKQMDFAKQVLDYTEFTLATQAAAEPDEKTKTELTQALRARNPQSRYLANLKKIDLASMRPEKAVALAEKGLAEDPYNEDFLMTVADFYMGREKDYPKVLNYALRILDLMKKKPKPESLTSEEWDQKKDKFTGWAEWMAGVVYGKEARYGPSDRYLRMALPYIQNDARLLAAAYFYLGYDNYALAGELNDKSRAIEAVKFSKLCAASDGPFRFLALKNLESLRNEFNVE